MPTPPRQRRDAHTTKEMVKHIHHVLCDEDIGLVSAVAHIHELLHELLERKDEPMTTQAEILQMSRDNLAKAEAIDDKMDAMKSWGDGIKAQITQLAADLAAALAANDQEALEETSANLTAAAGHIDTAEAEAAAIMNTDEEPDPEPEEEDPEEETPPA